MNINPTRCSKGHFYDPAVTPVCPQCMAEERAAKAPQGGKNPKAANGQSDFEMKEDDYGKTKPLEQEIPLYPDIPPTKPAEEGDNLLTRDISDNSVDDYDDETVAVGYQDTIGFSPVVGWLVCIDGPSKGKDYRIREGYNYIGRSPHMQICIEGDRQIGRERHASIMFDSGEMVFFFAPADGKNIVRLNDKLVMIPTQVNAYDVITIGATKLLFVPLCGERFNWNE